LALIADEEVAANPRDPQTVLLVPTDNDGVTEVLQMLEQELAAYEELDMAAIGTGRGGRGGRGRGRGRGIRSTRLEMEDLVDLAHETALSRYKVYIILLYIVYYMLYNVHCYNVIIHIVYHFVYHLMVAKKVLKDVSLAILCVPPH